MMNYIEKAVPLNLTYTQYTTTKDPYNHAHTLIANKNKYICGTWMTLSEEQSVWWPSSILYQIFDSQNNGMDVK